MIFACRKRFACFETFWTINTLCSPLLNWMLLFDLFVRCATVLLCCKLMGQHIVCTQKHLSTGCYAIDCLNLLLILSTCASKALGKPPCFSDVRCLLPYADASQTWESTYHAVGNLVPWSKLENTALQQTWNASWKLGIPAANRVLQYYFAAHLVLYGVPVGNLRASGLSYTMPSGEKKTWAENFMQFCRLQPKLSQPSLLNSKHARQVRQIVQTCFELQQKQLQLSASAICKCDADTTVKQQ